MAAVLLMICTLASCTHYARHYNAPKLQAGTFRARALLSPEQQRTFDGLFLEALRQKHKGNKDAAFDLLDHALTLNPNASEALYEAGRLLIELPMAHDSILTRRGDEMLLRAYQLEPRNPYFRKTLAHRWIQQDKYARAARLYEEMVAEQPNEDDLQVLVRLHTVSHNYPAALHALDRLTTLSSGEDAEQLGLQRFAIYQAMGDKTRAYQSITRLCEAHPERLDLRVVLADLYLQNDYSEAALAVLGDVLTTDSTHVGAHVSWLQYDYKMGNTEAFHQRFSNLMLRTDVPEDDKLELLRQYGSEAVEGRLPALEVYEHFREALAQPQSSDRIGRLAFDFALTTKIPTDSLVMPAQTLLRESPEDPRARIVMVQNAVQHSDNQEIVRLCTEGVQYTPQELSYYFYGALAHHLLGQRKEAIAFLQSGTQYIKPSTESKETELPTGIYALLGDLLHEDGAQREAYAAYEKALTYNADDTSILNNYAYFLSEDRPHHRPSLTKALGMSERLVALDADNPTFTDTHAWVLYRLGRYTEARKWIDLTLELLETDNIPSSSDANLYDHAGDIYYRAGRRREAIAHWKTALELSDNPQLTATLRRKLRTGRP